MMQLYRLDQAAQTLVLNALKRDPKSLNQGYKMRMTIAYGLERFWGESVRLNHAPKIADYWKETWTTLVDILGQAGFDLPSPNLQSHDVDGIKKVAEQLWQLPLEDQRIAIAVLTQLCDSIVWWTQRYKLSNSESDDAQAN